MSRGDGGIMIFGREVIREMNRIGMGIHLSHAGERTMLEAIEHSEWLITVTHANPRSWRNELRNVSDDVRALLRAAACLGFRFIRTTWREVLIVRCNRSARWLQELPKKHSPETLGIGSDLCQNQPDTVVNGCGTVVGARIFRTVEKRK